MEWKPKFLERYKGLTDLDAFLACSLTPLRKSIRVNTLKASVAEIKERLASHNLQRVPWCPEGFWLEGQGIGNLPEHFLGYIYLQEAASMLPPLALGPQEGDIVLDMAASPGSKTTQMAAMMKNQGLIVANDNEMKRLKPLSMNLQRCGVRNTVLTLMDGRWFKQEFDKVLLDAPCTGTGIIRKSYHTVEEWNPHFVKKLAGLQKQLLETAFRCVKEGGVVVYSTCSLEPEEDEGVVDFLLQKYDTATVEKLSLGLTASRPVEEFGKVTYSPEVKKCLRLWPQDHDTEGFFIAKIRKTSGPDAPPG